MLVQGSFILILVGGEYCSLLVIVSGDFYVGEVCFVIVCFWVCSNVFGFIMEIIYEVCFIVF